MTNIVLNDAHRPSKSKFGLRSKGWLEPSKSKFGRAIQGKLESVYSLKGPTSAELTGIPRDNNFRRGSVLRGSRYFYRMVHNFYGHKLVSRFAIF